MEILLQHRATGHFVAEEQDWVEASRDARKFRNAAEAVRFANAARFAPQVRLIARFDRDRYRILMPLLGSLPTNVQRL